METYNMLFEIHSPIDDSLGISDMTNNNVNTMNSSPKNKDHGSGSISLSPVLIVRKKMPTSKEENDCPKMKFLDIMVMQLLV
jgi:hypothetical protein